MRSSFMQRLFSLTYDYDDIIEHQRAQRLLYIIGIILIVSVIWIILISIPGFLNGQFGVEQVASPILLGVAIVLYYLIQRGQTRWASYIFVTLIFATTVLPSINDVNTPDLMFSMLPIVLAGVLLDRRALMLVTSLIVLIIISGSSFSNSTSDLNITLALALSFVVFLSGLFLALFHNSLEKITQSAAKLIEQTRRLNTFKATVTVDTTQQTMITNIINLFRSQLGFNYIRVIILDEDHQPLQTFYSSIGVEQVAEASAFSFTSNSAFQQAIETASPQIIIQQDLGNLSAHLLPSSSVGLIIPARSFNRTIALFDIQTESNQAIEQETVAILNLFIGQFASNLLYQRTVGTLRQDINEQENIINQQRLQLENIQHLQTEGIVIDWQNYLQQRGLDSIGYDIDNKRQISDLNKGAIPEELRPAFEKGETIVQIQEHEQLVTIPIHFRETILGAISFTIPEEIPMTDRKLEFIRSVTDRLALALDNKRLLEQTQTQAKREGVANEIGNILLTSTDVQTVLQTAADQFNEALGAISTQIYLQPASLQPNENQQREGTV